MNLVKNKQLCRELFEQVWNEGKLDTIGNYIHNDFLMTDPHLPVTGTGPQAARAYLLTLKKAFPDLHIVIEEQVAEDDKVVTRLSCTGTHEGELFGLAPSHKKATLPAIVIQQVSNDTIISAFGLWDVAGFMREVGAFAPHEALAGAG